MEIIGIAPRPMMHKIKQTSIDKLDAEEIYLIHFYLYLKKNKYINKSPKINVDEWKISTLLNYKITLFYSITFKNVR